MNTKKAKLKNKTQIKEEEDSELYQENSGFQIYFDCIY